VGVLDAFLSTWSHAHATFGEGVPQGGAQFDNSAQFRQLQGNVESAAPGSNWTGAGFDAYADANSRHGRTLGAMASLGKRLGAEVDRSAAVVAAGRRDLDAVKQWVVDAASTVPRTAAGERMLWPVVSKGASEIADIVQRSHGDLSDIAERLRGIAAEYQALGGDLKDGGAGVQPMNVVGEKQSGGGDEPGAVLDLNDIERRNPGQLGPDGYMELVPGSGVWVPDPNYRPSW
jgi:uncharacterized protein YukE